MNSCCRLKVALLAALLIASAFAWPVFAQSPSPAPKPHDDEFVTEKGFRSAVIEVKHRDPAELATVLRPISSGYKGATITANRDYRTISVRDFPENVAAIEAAVKRLDVAEAPRPDVELRIYVLVASAGEAGAAKYPEELAPAIAALKGTLQYRSYALAASFLQRVRDGSRGIAGAGTAEIGAAEGPKGEKPLVQAEYHVTQLTVDSSGPTPVIKLDGFSLDLIGRGRAQIKTDVSLREGEKVVVGTSTMRGTGLVVVLTARVVR